MKRVILMPAVALALLSLGGCSSMLGLGSGDYGCKGMPEGVTCKSARQVYDLTEAHDFRTVIETQAPDHGDVDSPDGRHEEVAVERPREVQGPTLAIPEPARDPLPIRTQATVMRIWVAPWESADGDLMVPGYIYTEIEPRRWEIGITAPGPQPTLRPLQVTTASRKAPGAQPGRTNPVDAAQRVTQQHQ